jgi:hypothetical protein
MPDAPPAADDAAFARARLQGKRMALGVVFVTTFAIIGSSALQIIPAVFGAQIVPIPAAQPGTPERQCAEGIRALFGALDRAADSAGSDAFATRLRPEWNEEGIVREACGRASGGLDAWAALERMRSAEEQLTARSPGELAPMRRDVLAHLPADLR